MKIYKIKSETELLKEGYFTGGSIWKNKDIWKLKNKSYNINNPKIISYANIINRSPNDLRFPVIDCNANIFGKFITNSKIKLPEICSLPYRISDDEMKIIYKWASEYEITKDDYRSIFCELE